MRQMLYMYKHTVSTVEEEMFDNKKILKKVLRKMKKQKSQWMEWIFERDEDMLCFTFQICLLSIYAWLSWGLGRNGMKASGCGFFFLWKS